MTRHAAPSDLTAELVARLVGAEAPAAALPPARGASFHSGRVRPGDAFFALPGERAHGIAFADAALEAGAAFVVSDRPHPRGLVVADPGAALLALGRHARGRIAGPVIGVTGSAGKTSTKALLAAALAAPASPGNLNTPWALACTLVRHALEAPEGPLVLELGIDHPGEMDGLVALVAPTHGVLTALAYSHTAALGDLRGVAREKAKLLRAAATRFVAIGAAPHLSLGDLAVRTYGLDPAADVPGRVLESGPEGQLVEALGRRLRLPHPGRGMAENAVAALAVAAELGIDPETAGRRLATATLEPGRLERKRSGEALVLDDTYNSNPASALQALEVLRAAPAPRVAVLGDMLELGPRERELHAELGRATRGLERVLAIGPLAAHLRDGNPEVEAFAGTDEALDAVRALPRRGTLLFKASRGMRLERLVEAFLGAEGAGR